MSPHHGIVVSAGSNVDFSSLARPQPNSPKLKSRAAKTNAGGVVVIVVLVVIILFGSVIAFLIFKNKYQKRKRQQKLQKPQPFTNSQPVVQHEQHEYRQLDDFESTPEGIPELPPETLTGASAHRKVELQADVNEVPRMQQLDGYAAPPRKNTQPVELPPNEHTARPTR